MSLLRIATTASVLLFVSSTLLARDFYLTVQGAGSRDGSGWEDAMGKDRLQTVFNETMQPGDRLLLGSGTYGAVALVLSRGGEAGRIKEIVGEDRGTGLPLFTSTWVAEQPTKGATAFRIEPGVSHVTIRGIRIRNYAYGVHAPVTPNGAARTHLRFEELWMEQIRHGFFLADCDDVQFRACVLKYYTKHGFRFEQGCSRVRLAQCVADCSVRNQVWETKTELFPFGYLLNDGGRPNTSFVFEECVARNHMMPMQTTKYKNGDGFVVEGNSSNVVFVRCRALRNQDAGFDLKVHDVRLIDCVAVGNSRGFRIWATGTLENCFSGWSAVALWNNGGPVRASRCTFHELSDAAVLTDDDATLGVTLADCLISAAPTAQRNTGRGRVTLQGTVVAASPGSNEIYSRLEREWDGLGNAMDCETFPDKGYRSSLHSKAQLK